MYRHFFWCADGNASISAATLFAQCTKHRVTCRAVT